MSFTHETPSLTVTRPNGGTFAIDWRVWQPTEHAVLCFVRDEDRLLLIVKKRGLGAGKVNAPGGRIEAGETPVAAAIRETQEEVGITPVAPREAGRLNFAFTNGYGLACTVFVADAFTGTPCETPEAEPFWQHADAIPYHRMWMDDRIWLPLLLAGCPFRSWFIFEDDWMLWHLLEFTPDHPSRAP